MGRQFDINAKYRFPDVGELKSRVLFRTQSQEPAEGGGVVDMYSDEYTLWGKLSPVSETIRIGSVQINNAITHKVVVRYRRQLYKSNQVVIDDYVYGIKGVTDVNAAKRFLVFSCEALWEDKSRHNIYMGFGY